MSEKGPSDRPSRLHRIAEAIATGGYGWIKIREQEPKEPWHPQDMTLEEYQNWERHNEVRNHLRNIAQTEPLLGKTIFDALRISDDPRYRMYAANMAPKLF